MFKNSKTINYVGIFLVAIIAFTVCLQTPEASGRNIINYNGIEISADEYETFINLGFSEDEIYYMDERIYNENKDLEATLVAQNKKYYKTVYPAYGNSYTVEVTPEEYQSRDKNELRGIIQTAWRTEVSSISAVNSNYRFKMLVDWDDIPPDKYYDVIGIGYNEPIHIYSNVVFYNIYTLSSGSAYTSYNYFDMNLMSTGGSFTYALPSSFVGLHVAMWYDVTKNNPNNTINSLYICGDYAHAETSVTGLQAGSHGIDVLGIDFDPSVIYYFDGIPCCDSYAQVNW